MSNSTLRFIGEDDWSRKLFKKEDGTVLVDVDGTLYTRTPDYNEPCSPTGIPTPTVEACTS